jgi:hypothetical protein
MTIRPHKIVRTYKEWEGIRTTGRGGKKKIRRDVVLTMTRDGVLEFHYTGWKNGSHELLATLDDRNTYTFRRNEANSYVPTYSNIYSLIGRITVYRDMSHYKHHAQPIRIAIGAGRWTNENGKWQRASTMPFANGIQYRNGVCLNPEIAVDYRRTLNRTLSLPWLRKTEVLAKVLRVATRLGILERKSGRYHDVRFEDVNIEDPTAADAEIIIHKGNAMGLHGWRMQNQTPELYQAALMRAAENGLADYREWLYLKHGCYEMLPVETKGEEQ